MKTTDEEECDDDEQLLRLCQMLNDDVLYKLPDFRRDASNRRDTILESLKGDVRDQRANLIADVVRLDGYLYRSAPEQQAVTLGVILSLKLPVPTFTFEGGRSIQDRYQKYAPTSLEEWVSFRQDATKYDTRWTSPSRALGTEVLCHTLSNLTVRNHETAVKALGQVVDYLHASVHQDCTTDLHPTVSSSSGMKGESSSSRGGAAAAISDSEKAIGLAGARLVPDMAIKKRNDVNIIVIEMKPPSFFGEVHPDLVTTQSNSHRICVRQLFWYMVEMKLGYGILSSSYITYFCKRVGDNGQGDNYGSLLISKGIKWTSRDPTLMEALHFIEVKALSEMQQTEKTKLYQTKRKLTSSESPKKDGEQDRERKKEDGDHVKKEKKRGKGYSPQDEAKKGGKNRKSSTGTGSSQRIAHITFADLSDTRARDLHLEDEVLSSGGWTGKVGKGFMSGKEVAVKTAFLEGDRAKALLKEITAYKILQSYWGKYVPELVNYGTTVHKKLVFIATELIAGSRWDDAPTEANWRAAEEALLAIHSCGLLHGDIHRGNIIFVEGGVRLLDFGFSSVNPSEADRKEELNRLKRLSETNCTSSVTQM